MGIYANKIFAESDVEDSYNTPDEIGIDLDQVEKDIMGPDGIEAHRDEVEDAVEGVVGDPLEECYQAMYESEYNFNQIMKCIGLNELDAYANGETTIMTEAADIKGWFESVKNWLVKQFKSLMEMFNKALDKMRSFFDMDRRYVEKHEKEIISGCKMMRDDGKTFTGYAFLSGDPNNAFTADMDGIDSGIIEAVNSIGKKAAAIYNAVDTAEDFMGYNEEKYKKLTENQDENIIKALNLGRFGVTKLSDVQDTMVKYLFNGNKVELQPGDKILKPAGVIGRLKNNPVTAIKKQYKEAKRIYDVLIKTIENAKSIMLKQPEVDNNIRDIRIKSCNAMISNIKTLSNVTYKIKCAYVKAYNARRKQDIAFAKKCVSYYNDTNKNKDKKKDEVTSESFAFSSINFI